MERRGAFCDYREAAYGHGLSGKTDLSLEQIVEFCGTALEFIDWSIAANRRTDGLFHTYNVLEVAAYRSGADILRLQEMLEGQVAVLSSGMLTPSASLDVLTQLFASRMYQPEERSFLLYPARNLPGFLEKNRVPAARVSGIGLLQEMQSAGDHNLILQDADGEFHFHGDLQCSGDVESVLTSLGQQGRWSAAVTRDRDAVLDLFEDVFQHKSFTGRSGTMYGYEGLGCIYWHMVAKLLLATQETLLDADPAELTPELEKDLTRMYFHVRAGIGYEKTVAEYGAFPTDPYSHTPGAGGAKQPGMTGQVKEEVLTRRGELGIRVQDGCVSFQPKLLKANEFLQQPEEFQYFDVAGESRTLTLPKGSLAFTLCQVPVVYELVDGQNSVRDCFDDEAVVSFPDRLIDAKSSAELFSRTGRITLIQVGISRNSIF